MNKTAITQEAKTASFLPPVQGLLQRKCACGNHTVAGGECAACAKNKTGLQRKLSIDASNDPLELEADRVAEQVIETPLNSTINSTPLRIQRFSGQVNKDSNTAPASVDRVLASSGNPLEPTLRQGMEQRFGHDFSQVRMHTGGAAEQSAHDVNADAYTVGHNVVFGAGQFAPRSLEGRRLIAHELTHVVQQVGRLQRQASTGADNTEITGFPAIDSMPGALTLDSFASDSAELTASHLKAVSGYKVRITKLLKQYPDSFITVAGHTDATDTEEHNRVLSQQRAEAVMAVLGEGDSAIPMAIMRAFGLGKTQLIVESKAREARNRRVEVSVMARSFSFRKPPAFTATPELPRGSGYVMPPKPPPIPAPPPKPDFFKPIPPAPKGVEESRSVLDLINETIVDPVVKGLTQWLPKDVQKKIVDLAHEGVEKGVTAGLKAALKDSRLTEKDRGDIIKAVENAIKLKDKPLDRKSEDEGSPWRQESEPSHVPEKPDDSQWK